MKKGQLVHNIIQKEEAKAIKGFIKTRDVEKLDDHWEPLLRLQVVAKLAP